jgi:hypothetical protein
MGQKIGENSWHHSLYNRAVQLEWSQRAFLRKRSGIYLNSDSRMKVFKPCVAASRRDQEHRPKVCLLWSVLAFKALKLLMEEQTSRYSKTTHVAESETCMLPGVTFTDNIVPRSATSLSQWPGAGLFFTRTWIDHMFPAPRICLKDALRHRAAREHNALTQPHFKIGTSMIWRHQHYRLVPERDLDSKQRPKPVGHALSLCTPIPTCTRWFVAGT